MHTPGHVRDAGCAGATGKPGTSAADNAGSSCCLLKADLFTTHSTCTRAWEKA
jgi:hypothetical protein